MFIQAPVIKSADLLVVGISSETLRTAVRYARQGKKVFAITSFAYSGEGKAANFSLFQPLSEADRFFFPDHAPQTQYELKYTLEQAMIREKIDFLYQVHPVRKVLAADGSFAGLLVADRSGFQIIACRAVIDGTDRLTVCRACDVPLRPFQTGKVLAERYLAGGSVSGEKLPFTVQGNKVGKERESTEHPVWRFTQDVEIKDGTAREHAALEVALRMNSWTPQTVYASDLCRIPFGDAVAPDFKASAALPIFTNPEDPALVSLLNSSSAIPVPFKVDAQKVCDTDGVEVTRKDFFYRFHDCPTVSFDLNSLYQKPEKYQVAVVGGGTGGAPAAIAAARSGVRTVCMENLYELGGVCTAGRICVYWYGNRIGFTHELDAGVTAIDPSVAYPENMPWKIIAWKAHWLLREAVNAGAEIRFGTMAIAALRKDGRVLGTVYAGPDGIGVIQADCVIDSTGSADVAAEAGAQTSIASPEEPAVQGAGLAPIRPALDYSNTDFQFICDHDVLDTTRAFVMGRAKFSSDPAFFDLSQISDTRERRRIVGDIELQPQDFYANRSYCDTINYAVSDFDTHGFIVHPLFLMQPTKSDKHFAEVPFRALLPKGLEGLLVTGLGISAHRDCMPLIRMQADVHNQGYAAGLAAAMAVALPGHELRKIDIRKLQRKLVDMEILPERVLTGTDEYPVIPESDPYCKLGTIFLNPEKALPKLEAKFKASPDVKTAAILAFHGIDSGKQVLADAIANTAWDTGWNYKGMGQAGWSSSPLDALIHAASFIGAGKDAILKRLSELTPESEFSHIRSVCMAFLRHPAPEAAPLLSALLMKPEMHGYAIQTYEDTIKANRPETNETTWRNSQLKEFYLARSLAVCDPGNADAARIMKSYREGLMGYYAMFC